MSTLSVDTPGPDRHGHTPIGVSRCPGCLGWGLFNIHAMAILVKYPWITNKCQKKNYTTSTYRDAAFLAECSVEKAREWLGRQTAA